MRIFSIILAYSLLTSSSLAAACPAEGLVKNAASAFRNAANAGSAQGFANATARFADMRALSMFALGPYRSKLPASSEAKYLNLSKAFMGRFMLQYADRISGSKIVITACSPTTVAAKFEGGGSITFRVRGSNKIEDVTVAGFSIASAMRSKFTGVIRNNNGDVNALLSYLAK